MKLIQSTSDGLASQQKKKITTLQGSEMLCPSHLRVSQTGWYSSTHCLTFPSLLNQIPWVNWRKYAMLHGQLLCMSLYAPIASFSNGRFYFFKYFLVVSLVKTVQSMMSTQVQTAYQLQLQPSVYIYKRNCETGKLSHQLGTAQFSISDFAPFVQ